MKVAVVGATGMVGKVILKVLESRKFPIGEIILAASEKSVGSLLDFRGDSHPVVSLQEAVEKAPDIAIFSAGGAVSQEWAPKFARRGTYVIDNSSAWRMTEGYPLIVPEINGHLLDRENKIIANPNCSTIQLVMILNPLHKKYGVRRALVSTYQSITGTGVRAVAQMENERGGINGEMAYHYPIDRNCIPHCDEFLENGYTKEEMKLTNETKKIMGDDSIQVAATAVRVPVQGGHSEAVNITLAKDFSLDEVRKLLHDTPGVILQDNPFTNTYPMPRFAEGRDEVFVGRIRRDFTMENTLNLWIVADNLRKGAATNTVQIAEMLLEKGFVKANR